MIIDNSGETNVDLVADENIGAGQTISFSELDSNSSNPKLQEKKEDLEENNEKPKENEQLADSKPEKAPEAPKSGKKIAFSDGIETKEISADIKLKHKVDGKEVEWTLQELLNDKAGQVSWDKKFQELSADKAKFKNERDVIEKYIEGFQAVAKKGDAVGAMEYLAQLAGISPLDFKKNLRNQMMPEFEKWQQMTDEAKKFKEIEEENLYFKQQRESEAAKVRAQQTQAELDKQLRAAQETYGFSDKDIVESYELLKEHYKTDQITFNQLTEYMKERNAVSKAEVLINQVDTDLVNDEKILDSIADLVLKNRHSDEELINLINSMKPKKNISKKSESKVVSVVDRKVDNKNTKQLFSFADLE